MTSNPKIEPMFGMGTTQASWTISKLFFLWTRPLIERGDAKTLYDLPTNYSSRSIYTEFQKHWATSPSGFAVPGGMRLFTALHSLIMVEFWVAGFYRFVSDLTVIASSLLIKQIVRASDESDIHGIVTYAFLIMINGLLGAIALQHFIHGCFLTGSKVASAGSSICFHATLRLRMHRLNPVRGIGEINNIQAKDTAEVREFVIFAHNLWSSPMVLAMCVGLLLYQLGAAGLVSCILLPLLLPVEARMSKWSRLVRKEALRKADARVNSVYELIDGIKTVKFTNWGYLEGTINAHRRAELCSLWTSCMIEMLNTVLTSSSILVVTLVTFAVYSIAHGTSIRADTAFSSLVIIGIIGRPMKLIPKCISLLADARVSCVRIEELISQGEAFGSSLQEDGDAGEDGEDDADFEDDAVTGVAGGLQVCPLGRRDGQEEIASFSALTLTDAIATRTPATTEVLSRISLAFPPPRLYGPGQGTNLVVITGDIASGKTSLLLLLLGELDVKGQPRNVAAGAPTRPVCAYIGHEPWILNGTVRDNIVLGATKFSEDAYERALADCCLSIDLEAWEGRDKTMIGEKGVNISGGQKQRIALARAILSPAPVLLLDSPLSGLDIQVAEEVFSSAVLGAAKTRLVLMTTHNPQAHVPHASRVIALGKGKVTFDGSYADYVEWAAKNKQAWEGGGVEAALGGGSGSSELDVPPAPTKDKGPAAQGGGADKKKDKEGDDGGDSDISKSESLYHTLALYARAASLFNVSLAFLLTCLSFGSSAYGDFLLSQWTNGTFTASTYLSRYSFVSLCVVLLNAGRYWMYAYSGYSASVSYHRRILRSVVGAAMKFFSRPSGRITSRFSADMDAIDNSIPNALSSLADSVFGIVTGVAVVMIGNPLYVFIVGPMAYKYYSIQAVYRGVSKQLKNLDSASKSPLYSHFRETLAGLEVIHAFGPFLQRKMLEKHYRLLDASMQARLNWDCTNRWLGIRLEIIGSLIVTAAAFSLLLLHTDLLLSPHKLIHPATAKMGGTAGLMMSYALKATQSLSFAIRASTLLENMLTSCDRVQDYIDTEQEEESPTDEGWEDVDLRLRTITSSGDESMNRSSHRLLADSSVHSGHDVEMPPAAAASIVLPSATGEVALEVRSLTARYSPSLPPSLRQFSFSLSRGSLTGVCGRTGSGKSTLAMTLMRAVPLESGTIVVDGRSSDSMRLAEYRQQVQLYPQDSFIFSGTVGFFVDPTGSAGEDCVNALLRELLLSTNTAATASSTAGIGSASPDSAPRTKSTTPGVPSSATRAAVLDAKTVVSGGGCNLSEGEKQCVILARCCLCSAKCIILDEITAHMDQQASEAALGIVKRELCKKGAAVVFISHRACDLLLCDEVLVLSGGYLLAKGEPTDMLEMLMKGGGAAQNL